MSVALQDQFRATGGSYVLEFLPGAAERQRGRLAFRDIADGLRLWRLALTLGWLDIRLRYRGSLLGPFWLTISTAIMVGSLGVLYATLFHMNIRQYLPFIALSQVLWGFIGGVVIDGCGCFTQAEGTIRAVRMPFFIHAIRSVVRNVLVLAHNAVVIVVVYVAFGINPGWGVVQSLGGVVLWLIAGTAICLPLGAVCARFRDIPQIVGSIMQIGFFLTPIIWLPSQLGPYEHLLLLNPFFDMLEVVRAPLLGYAAGVHVWEAAVLITLVLTASSFAIFARARARIAFWV
jgi:lipopolysaccharide transport system permease protein